MAWPPNTPILEELGILPGPNLLARIKEEVMSGRFPALNVGLCLELR